MYDRRIRRMRPGPLRSWCLWAENLLNRLPRFDATARALLLAGMGFAFFTFGADPFRMFLELGPQKGAVVVGSVWFFGVWAGNHLSETGQPSPDTDHLCPESVEGEK